MQAATVAPAPAVGRKRNIQATADYSDSEASQASVSAPASAGTTSKRARSSATASAASSSAAATASALLTTSKGKSKASSSKAGGGRKKSAKTESADPDDDDAASQQSQQDAAAITAGEEGDAPTQQLEELTAEEMFAQMDAEEAPSSRRGAKSGAQKSTAAAASSAADSTKLSAGQSAVLQRQRRNIWHQLYRLYDRLGEKDVLVGLTARLSEDASTTTTCSTSTTEVDAAEDALVVAGTVQGRAELTRRALDAELSGDFQEAVRIYASLNEASDQEEAAGDGEAESDVLHIAGISQEERNLWDERSLLCLRQLTDWQQLYDCVDKVARISLHDSADPDAMQPAEEPRLWEVLSGLDSRSERQNRLKEQVIPHYLQSLLHLGCPYSESPVAVAENERNTQERDAFIERVLSYQSTTVSTSKDAARTASQYELRQYIENTFPIELATAFASKGQWARTRLYCEQAHQRFLSQWSSLHPCATEARRQLLTQLQPILELRDAADFYSAAGISGGIGGAGGGGFGGGGGGAFTDRSRKQLISLVGKWEVTEPSIADATAHWANVTCNRHISLNSALQSAPVAGGACEGAAAVLRAAKVQLASMHVKTAAAAVHQGVLTAVKTQLEINNAIRRSGNLCKI